MQRYIVRYYSKRDFGTFCSKWNVFLKSLPSEFRESHARGGRKNIRARGDGGHQEKKTLQINMMKVHIHFKKLKQTAMIIAALFVIARNWKQMPLEQRMDQENVVHSYNGVLHSREK